MDRPDKSIRFPDLPLLSDEETRSLLSRAKSGDLSAREVLTERNLRLVMSIALKFAGRGNDLEELFQIGCIGLMKAIDGFDLRYDVKFSTYAVPVILGEIRKALRKGDLVSVGRPTWDLAQKVARLSEEIIAATGKEPTVAELSEHLGVGREEIALAMEAREKPASFSGTLYEDDEDGIGLEETLGEEDEGFEDQISRLALRQAISRLPPRLQRIVVLRYLEGRTQQDVARIMDLSQAQISRLERAALKRLKYEFGDAT